MRQERFSTEDSYLKSIFDSQTQLTLSFTQVVLRHSSYQVIFSWPQLPFQSKVVLRKSLQRRPLLPCSTKLVVKLPVSKQNCSVYNSQCSNLMRFHDLQISRKPNPRSNLIELDCFCDIYEDIAGGMFRRHADKDSNTVLPPPLVRP